MFDLEKFSNHQLTTAVRDSKLFKESCILDVLGKSIMQLEKENKTYKVTDKTSAQLDELPSSEAEIWFKLDQSHVRYIETEDCTFKVLFRRCVESFARIDL